VGLHGLQYSVQCLQYAPSAITPLQIDSQSRFGDWVMYLMCFLKLDVKIIPAPSRNEAAYILATRPKVHDVL